MNRKKFLASVAGLVALPTAAKSEKMVLYDDGYDKSWVSEDVANGKVKCDNISIVESCQRIRREAQILAEKAISKTPNPTDMNT